MARVAMLDEQELMEGEHKELVREIMNRRGPGGLLNLDKTLLVSPDIARGWNACFGALRRAEFVPGRMREACILLIAVMNGAEYEWQQHEAEFVAEGGTTRMMAALRGQDIHNRECFTDSESAALTLCVELTRSVSVCEETARKVLNNLGERGYLELVCIVSGYNMVSRVLVATGLPLERKVVQ